MLRATNLPALSHVENPVSEGEAPFFVTEEGRIGSVFRLPVIDAETPSFSGVLGSLTGLLTSLKPGVTLRWIHKTQPRRDNPFETSRADAIRSLGWMNTELFLAVESDSLPGLGVFDWFRALRGRQSKSLADEYARIRECADFAVIRELGGTALNETGIRGLWPSFSSDVQATRTGIDAGSELIGVLRLVRQGVLPLEPETLAILCESLVAPYEISVTVKKLSSVRAQYLLQRQRGHLSASMNSGDTIAAKQYQQTDEIAAETRLSGKGLVALEWLLVLRRRSEAELREDLETCQRALSPLGDLYIEVQGAAASFVATQLGSFQHHTFLELDDVAPYYLPVHARGENHPTAASVALTSPGTPATSLPAVRSLLLHRRDGSPYFFDLWGKGYDGANMIANGRRGMGKSVLGNLISSSLLQDPSIRLVKVDVGGSYVKECELYGGLHVRFNLSEPSGLNPFALLGQTEYLEDSAIILAGFLSTLILESRESVLSKEMLGAIEKCVLAYAEHHPSRPSLTDFLTCNSDFPRRSLLERFGPGGVFSNVLKAPPSGSLLHNEQASRYVYFNFERLQNAANEDFAQAVMAAVIAATNMEVLRAGDARRGAKNKVAFFADETPFFIQRNGRFFKLTTANFRKFGHATILIAQTTKDFELPREDGQTDAGILINSPIRFFYQIDDDPDTFAKRFHLTPSQITDIQNLRRTEHYREVFLQDELGGRVLRVAVTPEEYWRVTSSRADNERLTALLRAVPGLKLEEAIRCLAVS